MLGNFVDSITRCGIQYLFIDVSKNFGGSQEQMLKLFDILHHDTVYLKHANMIRRIRGENDLVTQPYHGQALKKPATDGFKGQLYVLQGTATSSAADLFCRIVAQNKLGILTGQCTGTLNTGFYISCWDYPNTQYQN